jgi:amino acid transporter
MGENALTKTITSPQTAVPFLADLFMLILALIFVTPIAQKFGTPSGLNTLLVGLGYILFCIGVFRLRKLENDLTKLEQSSRLLQFLMERRTRMVLGVLFGIGMMLFISQQFGYLELLFTDPYSLGEGQAAAFFVFAPSAWLGVSLFYIPVLAFTVTPTIWAPASGVHCTVTRLPLAVALKAAAGQSQPMSRKSGIRYGQDAADHGVMQGHA